MKAMAFLLFLSLAAPAAMAGSDAEKQTPTTQKPISTCEQEKQPSADTMKRLRDRSIERVWDRYDRVRD